LILGNYNVSSSWIIDQELLENQNLVKTMSAKPPMGSGKVRLVRIGSKNDQVDLQPCGGTHVKNTAEIGLITVGKIEKKGRQNRRINISLKD
jgi:misacylated tRNA(Ala) deacylase